MRFLGIAALGAAILSFAFWSAAWLYWNVLITELGTSSPVRYAAMAAAVLSAFFELIAISLVSIGILTAAKHVAGKQ